ncbi:MAG: DEAD/DEAH box helicase family protein [Chloroflexi bacterium]|nr:DEAD/DEAH box helicase family protein [Chloroflexota bacterium]
MSAMREHFYVLAAYYRRTLAILHSALEPHREALAAAALENVVVLQRSLSVMRQSSPNTALSTLALETDLHRRINEDLVYRILPDARRPLGIGAIVHRFNDLDVVADARQPAIEAALLALVQTGHVVEHNLRFRATEVPYVDANVDRMELTMLVGPQLAHRLSDAGFEGLSSVLEQRDAFKDLFKVETGFSEATSVLAVACAEAMAESAAGVHGARGWPHRQLTSSAHPRPYQRLLHAIFRAHRYAGQVIEAPAGSGKTFVGMLCIEDWLRMMPPGQSILVVVPTANYQRQWFGEPCLNLAGLGLAPHLVFTGTPRTTMTHRSNDIAPVALVMTCASLARLGSGDGRGGFDGEAIERFLQSNNVRHVILDEVHKVTANLSSATADMTRVILRWLDDGSVRSVIGFSGAVLAHERQL